jgi:D-sedoheptulose 7-phosphate isomerase
MTLVERVRKAKRVYIIGNGGSYANAVHICNDLLSCGVRAFTLDPATLTATANDHGYEFVFSKWLLAVADEGDLLIALSGSGKSANITNAITAAHMIGMDVHKEFGALKGLDMQASEEKQVELGHDIMRTLKAA